MSEQIKEKRVCAKCGRETDDWSVSSGGEYAFLPVCDDCDEFGATIRRLLSERKDNNPASKDDKQEKGVFMCRSALDNCVRGEWSYGMICVRCNFCKRYGNGKPMVNVDMGGEDGCYACPVCENEELKPGDKFCKICGNEFNEPIPDIFDDGRE